MVLDPLSKKCDPEIEHLLVTFPTAISHSALINVARTRPLQGLPNLSQMPKAFAKASSRHGTDEEYESTLDERRSTNLHLILLSTTGTNRPVNV